MDRLHPESHSDDEEWGETQSDTESDPLISDTEERNDDETSEKEEDEKIHDIEEIILQAVEKKRKIDEETLTKIHLVVLGK